MGLKRMARIVSARKWYVIAAALFGALIGFAFTVRSNEQRQGQFEATAILQVVAQDDTRDRAETEEDIQQALLAAEEANQEVIEQGRGRVVSDEKAGQLIFSTRAREEALAAERAEAMRSAYLEATAQGTAEDRQSQLDEIVEEASQILVQLDELGQTPTDAVDEPETAPELDPDVAARLDVLNSLVAELTNQHTKLEVDLILAEAGDERAGDPEDIQSDLDAISDSLDDAYTEIAEISAENGLTPSQATRRPENESESNASSGDPRESTFPSEARSPEELQNEWTISALQSRYEELATDYEALFIEERATEPAEVAAATVEDITPTKASPRLFTALGFVLGALAAAALAVGEATLRGRAYDFSDVSPLNGITEIPAAGGLLAGRPGLRVASASPGRVEGIHGLRLAIMAMMDAGGRSPVLGLTRVGVDHLESATLATDLARRLAASGRSTLVLDLDFGAESVYSVSASSLSVAELISRARVDPESAAAQMKRSFAEVTSTEPFRLVRAGELTDDPADVVLTDGFQVLLDVAREQSDIVLVVTPEGSSRATFSLLQRLDGFVEICAWGTRRASLLSLAQPGPSAAVPLGVVFLKGWRPRGRRRPPRISGSTATPFQSLRRRLGWRRSARNSSSESST